MDATYFTLVFAAIGAFAACITVWYNFQRPKVKVHVKYIPSEHMKSSVDGEIYIIAANVCHKNIQITPPNVPLDDGRVFKIDTTVMSDPNLLLLPLTPTMSLFHSC